VKRELTVTCIILTAAKLLSAVVLSTAYLASSVEDADTLALSPSSAPLAASS
jgi:hypothetical protein